jgi:hypothetical protein
LVVFGPATRQPDFRLDLTTQPGVAFSHAMLIRLTKLEDIVNGLPHALISKARVLGRTDGELGLELRTKVPDVDGDGALGSLRCNGHLGVEGVKRTRPKIEACVSGPQNTHLPSSFDSTNSG